MKNSLIRRTWCALALALLASCGGGSDGGVSSGAAGLGNAGLQAPAHGGSDNAGGDAGGSGGSSGGSSGSASGDGTTTAGAGDSDSGVGSGGTGATSATASAVGSVDGFGSIIVGGIRYNVDSAALRLADASALQLGMTVQVTGTVNPDFTSGVANDVQSAADLRGPADIDPGNASLRVLGTTVHLDSNTVMGNFASLSDLPSGTHVQVWGLPAGSGTLRATRIEAQPATQGPVVSGFIAQLDPALGTFMLGSVAVDYRSASFSADLPAGALANGVLVRVRAAAAPGSGPLVATGVIRWYATPQSPGTSVQIEGVVTNYQSIADFRLMGVKVDASAASLVGGPAAPMGDGVKVVVSGEIQSGTLVARKLRIRSVPGAGGPPAFELIGTVAHYDAATGRFRVRGQPVDASGAEVLFVNGSAAGLDGTAVQVTVLGSRVVDGVLLASQVTFR